MEPISITIGLAITGLVKTSPQWLSPIRDAFLSKTWDQGAEFVIDRGKKGGRDVLRLDEKKQVRHLQLAIQNAAERGLAQFNTLEERDIYRDALKMLSEEGQSIEELRREALRLFTLNETPDFIALAASYHLAKRIGSMTKHTTYTEIDIAPYLSSFFNALVAELYADPLYRQQMSDVLRMRTDLNMQRSLVEVVETLHKIYGTFEKGYTAEQFEKDVQTYTEYIERTLRYLKLVGVVPKERINENRDPELNGIFVPLQITMQNHATSIEFLQGIFRSMKDLTILYQPNLYITELLEQAPTLVVLGGPGSGKSTVTRHLAWSHAAVNLLNSTISESPPLLSGKPLPLRIELRRLNEVCKQRPDYDFLGYASEVLLKGLDIPPQMFKILLERKMMVLLFDGLDEVATLDDRRTIVEEIESFVFQYPGNCFLVTSRPVGYELAPLSGQVFSRAQVQPFSDEQIHLFLEHWYKYVLRLWPLSLDDQQELEELGSTLKNNPRLHDLAENPLLLTVITALHRYERLPDRRILLYDRCADLLLETWSRLRGTNIRWQDLKMSKEDQYACVAHLGFVLHESSQAKQEDGTEIYEEESYSDRIVANDVPSRLMLQEIKHFLQKQNLFSSIAEQNSQAKRFLELIQEETGLIVERGTDENDESLYGFVHRTFQEYFAAAYINESYLQENDPEIISDFLKKHLHDPHWSEVILLLFGKLKRKPATMLLRRILEGQIQSQRSKYTNIIQQDLFFVCSCLIEEIPVEIDLSEIVISRLGNMIINSAFPSQRSEALQSLAALMHTRQYATLARQRLTMLITKGEIADISTTIEASITLFQHSDITSEERERAIQLLLGLAQNSSVSLQYAIQAAWVLYKESPDQSIEEQQSYQALSELVQRASQNFEQCLQTIQHLSEINVYLSSKKDEPIRELLLKLARQSNFSIEQGIQVALAFSEADPFLPDFDEEMTKIVEGPTDILLSDLVRRPDLSVEQALRIFEAFSHRSSQADKQLAHLIQMFLNEIQQFDNSIERTIKLAQGIYQNNQTRIEDQSLAHGLLLKLAQQSDLSVEQVIQVVLALNPNPFGPFKEDKDLVTNILLRLAKRRNLSFIETLQIARNLYQITLHSVSPEKKIQARDMILQLTQHSKLSIEQTIQATQTLYEIGSSDSDLRQQAIQTFLQLAQSNTLSVNQRLQATTSLFLSDVYNLSIFIKLMEIVIDLIPNHEKAKQYVNQYWSKKTIYWQSDLLEVPNIVNLIQQDILPTEACDMVYRTLYDMVPQFDKLGVADE